jgi:UDP-N-acetylmuramoylalanine--D-glutamate ligase
LTGRFGGERAVVVGAGVAGAAAARVLVAEGAEVRITEALPEAELPEVADLRELGIDVRADGHEPDHLDGATLVVLSPGVAPHADVIRWARQRGLPSWGEMELGARLADAPYLAVTGTNGKTTTAGMLASCLRAAGIDAVACGNIGHPFPVAAREGHDALVVECSSFQLAMQESFHPQVSVLLNVAPDHLDWHGTFEAYAEAKARIFAGQTAADTHVGNRDDERSAALSRRARCRLAWFSEHEPSEGEVGYRAAELVSMMGAPERMGRIPGDRAGFRANAAAAAACALAFGVPARAVEAGLRGFVPAPHRGETVAEYGGVRFVDDSKATNVHAATAALAGAADVVLIAGGRAKGADLTPLAARADHLRGVVAIGEAAPQLVEIFETLVPVATAVSIEEAVRRAFEMAGPGSTVLLAPACASWDQFRDYRERGDRFAAAARALREVDVRG